MSNWIQTSWRRFERSRRIADREEVVQDVLIELFRQLRQRVQVDTLLGRLKLIVRSVCADYYRRVGRRGRNQGVPLSAILDVLVRCDDSPGEREVDFRDHLHIVLSPLPERLQWVVRAVWIDGCSKKEVAAALGITAPSLTRLLNRARELLAPLLRPAGTAFPEHCAN